MDGRYTGVGRGRSLTLRGGGGPGCGWSAHGGG